MQIPNHPEILAGIVDEDEIIDRPFETDAQYSDNANYDFFPTKDNESYNSNGYASGLLEAVGYDPRGYEAVFEPPYTPGFNIPLPFIPIDPLPRGTVTVEPVEN